MSFQAYLDAIETKTGLTPQRLLEQAHERGFDADSTATPVLEWLKAEYGLGRGHGMALVHVLKNGPTISDRHVGADGVHRDSSTTLRLTGAADA